MHETTNETTTRTIELVYLARLREAFGCGGETFEFTHDASTVAALLESLRARGGAFAAELAPGRAVRVAVNHVMAGPETAIATGDEVAVFPPVTGG